MKRPILLLFAALAMTALTFVIACGGNDDDDTSSAVRGDGTPGASRTNVNGTPVAGVTNATGGTPRQTGPTFTPVPPDRQTRIAEDIIGFGTPEVISTLPAATPAAGTTAVVDPTQIAEPDPPSGSGLRVYIDLNASAPGIQSSRDVSPGDTFKVAVVVAGVPPKTDQAGGLSAFQFTMNYDKRLIVAPTIEGGPATDRNPDLNLPVFGGDPMGWFCLPAPEGDRDDEAAGGANGDNNPETGQAQLSCFTGTPSDASGTMVLGVTTFVAADEGTTTLHLAEAVFGDWVGIELGSCDFPGSPVPVPCADATVTVR